MRTLTDGGADHAFEVVGIPETILLAWKAIRPGATAIVVGLAAKGVDVGLPAIELLSDKGIRGSYYGSGDPAKDLVALAGLAASGDLELGGVVTHLGGLDDVPHALERLRRGEGGRTILVLDPESAGAPTTTDGGMR
jgi:S-(hydroxymethyl)glutathione dehydrogenase/alcohol dehydrogenase